MKGISFEFSGNLIVSRFFVFRVVDFKFWLIAYLFISFNCAKFHRYWTTLILDIGQFAWYIHGQRIDLVLNGTFWTNECTPLPCLPEYVTIAMKSVSRVLYMSFDRFLLAVESRDLSQADKSIIRVPSLPKLSDG